ncbi:unnamed protein product, partial [Rotaria sp. Silwood2]
MLSDRGVDKNTVNIFLCDENHSMNSTYFIGWLRKAAAHLRHKHREPTQNCIVLDNARWHNELCDDAKPPKRSWRKNQIEEWLTRRSIKYESLLKKAQLLELAIANAAPKKFKTDAAA